MSEIGLVQAAMNKVDKIRKKMLNFIVSTETFIFSDVTHWLIDSFDSLILYTQLELFFISLQSLSYLGSTVAYCPKLI